MTPLSRRLVHGQLLRAFVGHTSTVAAVAVLPDGRRALSSASDWSVILWDLETADPIAAFIGDADMTCIALAGDLFIAGSTNGAAHLLRLCPGKAATGAIHSGDSYH